MTPRVSFVFLTKTVLGQFQEAAKDTSREVYARLGARFAKRVASSVGDEVVARIAGMGSRAQLEPLREVLSPEQYALVTQLYDIVHGYAMRASAADGVISSRVSSNH